MNSRVNNKWREKNQEKTTALTPCSKILRASSMYLNQASKNNRKPTQLNWTNKILEAIGSRKETMHSSQSCMIKPFNYTLKLLYFTIDSVNKSRGKSIFLKSLEMLPKKRNAGNESKRCRDRLRVGLEQY